MMPDNRSEYPKRLSVQVTKAMDDRLEQVARGRDEAKSEVIRAALRAFLDEQEDVIGSRKHFTKAFGRRIDHLERLLVTLMAVSLDVKQLFLERIERRPVDLGDLLEAAIRTGVRTHELANELVEAIVTLEKTKPPA